MNYELIQIFKTINEFKFLNYERWRLNLRMWEEIYSHELDSGVTGPKEHKKVSFVLVY